MNTYENPLIERYASKEMSYNFSPGKKFITWRKLWISLAKTQKELGLPISQSQIDALEKASDKINFEKAKIYEEKFKHDVMAHIHAFGDEAPQAKGIIHLGATSAFVGDNTDLIQIRDGLKIIQAKLIPLLYKLKKFSLAHKGLPTLGFTHYQPAQLTTVGKRATLWIQSLLLDLKTLEFRLDELPFRGVKGTTGTAASFKDLFNGDFNKIKELDKKLSLAFGFEKVFSVTGQTYDRKIDAQILHLLSEMAQSAHKFTNDLRLLQNLKEIEEPFEKDQIGSSAMAYKRNPMRSERIASLSKFVISLSMSSSMVAATQWFERTLDDSANRRLAIAQSFLAIDAILLIWNNIVSAMVVYPKMIQKHIEEELPFMATEAIIIEGVKNGADRQEIHERIRIHSMKAAEKVKIEGMKNDLIERILSDKKIPIDKQKLSQLLDPMCFIGFAQEQTQEFIEKELNPILEKYKDLPLEFNPELKV